MHAVYSSPAVMRYWSREPHEDKATTLQLGLGLVGQPDPVCHFVIDRDSVAVGCCGVHDRDQIGFLLHPDHWRQGLMREALDAFIPHAGATLGLDRLSAEADPRNAGSIGVLTALGFVETYRKARTVFLYGDWCDSVFLARQLT